MSPVESASTIFRLLVERGFITQERAAVAVDHSADRYDHHVARGQRLDDLPAPRRTGLHLPGARPPDQRPGVA
jgi:hypothetical protein